MGFRLTNATKEQMEKRLMSYNIGDTIQDVARYYINKYAENTLDNGDRKFGSFHAFFTDSVKGALYWTEDLEDEETKMTFKSFNERYAFKQWVDRVRDMIDEQTDKIAVPKWFAKENERAYDPKAYEQADRDAIIDNAAYTAFIVVDDKLESGWEYREDAQEHAAELKEDGHAPKIWSRKTVKRHFQKEAAPVVEDVATLREFIKGKEDGEVIQVDGSAPVCPKCGNGNAMLSARGSDRHWNDKECRDCGHEIKNGEYTLVQLVSVKGGMGANSLYKIKPDPVFILDLNDKFYRVTKEYRDNHRALAWLFGVDYLSVQEFEAEEFEAVSKDPDYQSNTYGRTIHTEADFINAIPKKYISHIRDKSESFDNLAWLIPAIEKHCITYAITNENRQVILRTVDLEYAYDFLKNRANVFLHKYAEYRLYRTGERRVCLASRTAHGITQNRIIL